MTQTESYAEKPRNLWPPNLIPLEFAEIGKRRVEELVEVQTELFEKLQEANRDWFHRIQSETAFAAEFCAKLTAGQSVVETLSTCQEWAWRRMEMAAEDAGRLMIDRQKFMETGARFLSNGWFSNGWRDNNHQAAGHPMHSN